MNTRQKEHIINLLEAEDPWEELTNYIAEQKGSAPIMLRIIEKRESESKQKLNALASSSFEGINGANLELVRKFPAGFIRTVLQWYRNEEWQANSALGEEFFEAFKAGWAETDGEISDPFFTTDEQDVMKTLWKSLQSDLP